MTNGSGAMTQVVSGLRRALSFAAVYDFFQNLVGGPRSRQEFVRCYVRPEPGQFILDIGCGTADILAYLPEVAYYGFDPSQQYVEAARRRFGERARLTCATVTEQTLQGLPKFDLVLAIGVLHHLGDSDAVNLFRLAKSAMKPGGRLVTLDGCYVEKQSRIARFLISRDRGQNVRYEQGYRALAESVFDSVKSYIRHDLTRIPYTHVIVECEA
jgi:SAM-dependent methyltransferase